MPTRIPVDGGGGKASVTVGGSKTPIKIDEGSGKHHGGGGFFDTIGSAVVNLGTGAERAVLGIPSAVVTVGGAVGHDTAHLANIVSHGIAPEHSYAARSTGWQTPAIATSIGKAYAYKYGPLFTHGDVRTTARRALVEDPFGTILDVATVASLGAGAVTKVLPEASTALRELPLRGPEALAKAGKLNRPLKGVTVIENAAPITTGGRAVRGTAAGPRAIHAILNKLPADTPIVGELRRFNRAIATLPRKAAARRRLIALPLDRTLRTLSTPERQAAALIARWPLPRLLDAQVAKWQALDDAGALKIATDPEVRALYDNPSPKIQAALAEAKRLGDADAEMLAQYGKLDPETAAAAPYLHMRVASGATFDAGDLVGGESIDALKQELAATGRPEPVYLHDTAIDKGTGPVFRSSGGGRSPIPQSPVKQNQAVLASLGQLLLDPSTLLTQHFRSVKYALYRDIHSTLESAALRVPKGTRLPEGYEYLRRAVTPSTGERIGYAEQTAGEFHRQLETMLPNTEAEAKLGEQLTTLNEAEAATVGDDRLIVPKSTVSSLTGEFERSSKAVRWIVERPLDVWRWLLLNWSPRWLTNNLVGNSFMSLLRFGGPTYIKNWLAAVFERGGPAAIDRLLKDQHVTGRLTAADIAELFPEQVTGTFKGQNTPDVFAAGVAAGRLKRLVREGLTPIDRGYEQALRRAAINTVARKSPEVVRLYKQMPRQTREWRAATKQALAENPALAKKISQEVNSGLGDFTSMSAFERNWLRRLVPFYGWYRAITTVVLRLPLEIPIRARLVAQLSQIQQEDQDLLNPDLPSYLRGAIPFGDNGGILKTQGVNPYATLSSVGRGADFAARGGNYDASQTFLGMINPELQGLVASIPGRNEQSKGLLMNILLGMYGSLPPVTAVNLARHGAPPSKLYEPSTSDQLSGLLGAPIRHLRHPIVSR